MERTYIFEQALAIAFINDIPYSTYGNLGRVTYHHSRLPDKARLHYWNVARAERPTLRGEHHVMLARLRTAHLKGVKGAWTPKGTDTNALMTHNKG